MAGGTGSRLYPVTISVNKQLMPVYDKPMIFYSLSILMLCGIREVLIISTPSDLPLFKKLFEDGSLLGMKIFYAEQYSPDGLAQALIIACNFLDGSPSCLVLGDNILYGHNLKKTLRKANIYHDGATVFGYSVNNPEDYGNIEFSPTGKAINIEEKPVEPKSSYAIPGIYFYDKEAPSFARNLEPSARDELEITDLNRLYLSTGKLHVVKLDRGTVWMDTGNIDTLLEASNFVQIIERCQGIKIACIEEIALTNGWIDREIIKNRIMKQRSSSYNRYLEAIIKSN